MTLLYYIYPRIMPEVNVSATVEMSATVGVIVCDSGGNVCNSGEIEHGLGNLRVIHNSAYIT